mmetsp:Transcript_4800/g.19183  ORF Transcript_4800/g.19183 Transcript_4800/m.19183 type:complete len:316 (+) Transcript_4800:1052-1999(+)
MATHAAVSSASSFEQSSFAFAPKPPPGGTKTRSGPANVAPAFASSSCDAFFPKPYTFPSHASTRVWCLETAALLMRPASRKAPFRNGPAIVTAKMPTPVAPSALLPQPYTSPRRSTNTACSCFKETCVATRRGANAQTHQRSLANLFFLFGTGCASETVSASFSETDPESLSASDPESASASPSNEPSLSFDPPSAHAPTLAALLKHRHVFPRSSNRNVVVLPAAAATTRAPARKRHSRRRGRGDDVAENGIEPVAEYTPHWPQSLAPHAQAPPAASTAAECSAPAATDTANAGGFFFLFFFLFVLTSKDSASSD